MIATAPRIDVTEWLDWFGRLIDATSLHEMDTCLAHLERLTPAPPARPDVWDYARWGRH